MQPGPAIDLETQWFIEEGVRKPEVAEDLVQETFLAAVRGYEKFGGRSSERV